MKYWSGWNRTSSVSTAEPQGRLCVVFCTFPAGIIASLLFASFFRLLVATSETDMTGSFSSTTWRRVGVSSSALLPLHEDYVLPLLHYLLAHAYCFSYNTIIQIQIIWNEVKVFLKESVSHSLFLAIIQGVGGGQSSIRAWLPPAGEGLFFRRTTSGQLRLPWWTVAYRQKRIWKHILD